MGLRRDDGFAGRGDDVYEALRRAHLGLDDEASAALDARLVLILANQIGDPEILAEAFAVARASLGADATARESPDGSARDALLPPSDIV